MKDRAFILILSCVLVHNVSCSQSISKLVPEREPFKFQLSEVVEVKNNKADIWGSVYSTTAIKQDFLLLLSKNNVDTVLEFKMGVEMIEFPSSSLWDYIVWKKDGVVYATKYNPSCLSSTEIINEDVFLGISPYIPFVLIEDQYNVNKGSFFSESPPNIDAHITYTIKGVLVFDVKLDNNSYARGKFPVYGYAGQVFHRIRSFILAYEFKRNYLGACPSAE